MVNSRSKYEMGNSILECNMWEYPCDVDIRFLKQIKTTKESSVTQQMWSYNLDYIKIQCLFSKISSIRCLMEKEMATHSSVLAWRIPGMGEPGGLPSLGSHRVGHDWSDSAVAASAWKAKSHIGRRYIQYM